MDFDSDDVIVITIFFYGEDCNDKFFATFFIQVYLALARWAFGMASSIMRRRDVSVRSSIKSGTA